VDGLHVTGTPVEVDIDTYRLRIDGLVEREASYSYDEIRAMDAQSIDMVLVCPGTFTDQGTWTGVQLRNLLEPLGVDPAATKVRFHSIDESYSLAIDIDQLENDVLVAWAFNGREFPVYHGYPLRICADGVFGAYWVKWLGRIEVQ
jgi:DMSO/TMAO reductase YedYZ molybdopterin-dependent catalytic subunit